MVMPRIEVVDDTDLLLRFRGLGQRFPVFIKKRFRQISRPIRKQMLATLRIKPNKWSGGKRRWNSRRQQSAYFASDGFGSGIPYERTDDYIDSFEVNLYQEDYSGFLQVENDDPKAEFVGGPQQQLMHQDTGWQRYDKVIDEKRPGIAALLAVELFELEDPLGGI